MTPREAREAKWTAIAATPTGLRDCALREAKGEADPILLACLELAVPMWIEQWAGSPFEVRQARAKELGMMLLEPSAACLATRDIKPRGGLQAKAFNALAEGLAIGAFQPDGARFAECHWQVVDGRLLYARA